MKKILMMFICFMSIAYGAVPKRAVTLSQFTTEILLALGAENQMVGTAFMDNEILPELKEKYEKIEVLSTAYPSKEKFYSYSPDFITGWSGAITDKNMGSQEELENNGVQVFIMKSINSNRLEDMFEDIYDLGKIFGLEKNSQILVENMKAELKEIEVPKETKKMKVFAYDSGEDTPFVVGNGLGNTIIEMAGGKNIFRDVNRSFGSGSWEKILEEDPEFILIVDYGNTSAETKIKFLKERSPIKDLDAVKNDKFGVIELADLSPGIRNVRAIKKLHNELVQNIF